MALVQFFKDHKYLLSLFSSLVFVSLFAGVSTFSLDAMWWSFRFVSYYVMWGLLVFWLWTLYVVMTPRHALIKDKFKEHRFDLLGIFFVCVAIFFIVKPEFRIEADESALSLVSYTLVKEKAAHLISHGFWSLGNFLPIEYTFPIRPLSFPFFLHLIHSVLGYKASNVFILNFVTGFSLLSFLFVLSRQFLTRLKSWTLLAALLSFPIFTLCFTSAGFDLFHMAFFSLLAFANFHYLKNKNSASLLFLWATFLLYAQTRYEAGLIGAFFFLPFLVKRKYSWILIKENLPLLLISSIGIFPFIWQCFIRVIKFPNYLGFEDMMSMPTQGAFSLDSFLMNFKSVVKAVVIFDYYLPFNNLLIIAALLGLAYILYRDVRRKPLLAEFLSEEGQLFVAGVFFASLVHFIFILSFILGMINLPQNTRLFLPEVFFVMLILSIILMKVKISDKGLWGFALLNFFFYFPVTTNSAFHKDIPHDRSRRFVYDFIEKNKLSKEFVLVTTHPALYTSHQYGAINFNLLDRLPNYVSDKLLKTGLIKHVYVLQDYPLVGDQPLMGYELPPGMGVELIPLEEILIADDRKARISELVLKK